MKKIIRSNALFSSVQRVILEIKFSESDSRQVSMLASNALLPKVVTTHQHLPAIDYL